MRKECNLCVRKVVLFMRIKDMVASVQARQQLTKVST